MNHAYLVIEALKSSAELQVHFPVRLILLVVKKGLDLLYAMIMNRIYN